MRTFDHFPEDAECVVCGTSEDRPCVLVSIQGTSRDGIVEATPVHADCVDPTHMVYHPDVGVIYIACKAEGQWLTT